MSRNEYRENEDDDRADERDHQEDEHLEVHADGREYHYATERDHELHGSDSRASVLIGNGSSDRLYGGRHDDRFEAGDGDDYLDGGSGIDTSVLLGRRSDYLLEKSGSGYLLQSRSQSGGSDQLQNVERLQFADSTLALDIDGHAGQMYRLYQAAFNRTPDNAGLKYWIGRMDQGLSLGNAADAFTGSSEFQALNGGSHPDPALLVKLLYRNALHREADDDGLGYWAGRYQSGSVDKATLLAAFSESAENQAAVIGAIGDGIPLY